VTRERRLSLSTGALAALLALLAIYVYLIEVRGGEKQEREQQAVTHLLPFPSTAATELVIERPGERIVCRKEHGQWRILAPIRAAADDTTVDRILTDLAESKIDRTVSTHPADLTVYGLAPASGTATHQTTTISPILLTVSSGKAQQTVEIGKENPTGSFVFACRLTAPRPALTPSLPHSLTPTSGSVLLVERRVRDAAEKKLYDLRDKTVLDFSPDDVNAISYTQGGATVRMARQAGAGDDPQPGWQLVRPLRVRADRGAVERSLNLVSSLRAEQFASEKPEHLERFGLDRPWGSARFDLKGGHAETLLLGRKTTEGALTRYFARKPGAGPVFTINDNLPRDAQQAPQEWRERHATDFTRADVAELRLISPGRTVVCAKKENSDTDEWGVAEFSGPVAEGMNLAAAARMASAQRADRDRVNDLLAHLGTLEAKAFLDGAKAGDPRFGLARPSLKVVALDKAGKTLASISFGSRAGDRVDATGPHLGGVFQVPASDIDRFRIPARDLAARS
jgi:hypothetical protein